MIAEHQTHFRLVQGDFRFFLCRIAFLLFMALNPVQGGDASRTPQATRSGYASTTYQLTAGWNLISINLILDAESKTQLQNKGAMALDANSKAYVINDNIAVSQACWLYCQKAETLILSGNLPPKDFDFAASLKSGWNFVGPLATSVLSSDGSIAWGWHNGRFYPTDTLRAGHGYFLYWSEGNQFAPAEDTYLVIDLSAGPAAIYYPVSCLSAPPDGGWTEEYKTTKLVLRKIPAGTFMMGSPEGELGREDKETQHQVTLSKDFYVGVFEVTQKQWNLVMDDWPSWHKNESCRDSRPVEYVNYEDIRGRGTGLAWPVNNAVDVNSFLGRLRAKTSLNLDLPTEAQWEYACRAGTTTALNSEEDLTDTVNCPNLDEFGRYIGNKGADDSAEVDTSGGTAEVGSYRPNRWGLYDMHGNVWECCLDLHADYNQEAQTDPTGPDGGYERIVRGGSYVSDAHYCRSARRYRVSSPMLQEYRNLGLRLAVQPEPEPEADTYLVIDLSAGSEATTYPFTYRTAPPPEGWTEEYKTTKLVLRKIPAGAFVMGSPENELGRTDEENLHQVFLTRDFYAGVFEVTQKQWSLVMGEDKWPSYFSNGDWRDSRPVEQVSYEDIRGGDAGSGWPANNLVDATSFLGQLRKKTGLSFDLPTEAQWEYACRGRTTTALNSRKNLTAIDKCPNMDENGRYWYNGGEDGKEDSDASVGSAIVGSYRPNGWGLYDMHGNVSEWCLDWWDGSAYLEEAVKNPTGSASGNERIVRGGGLVSYTKNCRSACRMVASPSMQSNSQGFRLFTMPAADTYLVIDLSAGSEATTYPFDWRATPPPEGWTEEYKTTKLVLRKIPAGTFMMGSPENELGRVAANETQHQVTLTRDFYAGIFEVTQKQWSLVMGNWPSCFSHVDWRDSRPVERVSYEDIRGSDAGSGWPDYNTVDATSFLGQLRKKTGLSFDLPTEAQWEYACRAGTTTALNSGKNLTDTVTCPNMNELGRYMGNKGADNSAGCDPSSGTATVGSYKPNGWGLYDMHGNVSEWCLDWSDSYNQGMQTDPNGPRSGFERILRGGSWSTSTSGCRSAYRNWAPPSEQQLSLGFRLVTVPAADTFLVFDLSAGSEAASYPFDCRATPPPEGWTDEYKTTKLVLRKIPAGTFVMGSPEGELGREDTETQHQVTLSKGFYAGIFEVTQKQWSLVMGEDNWPGWFSNPFWRDSRPVEKVSYEDIRGSEDGSCWPANNLVDATSFLGKLRGKTGLDFDLPTEAQWEYACRAGTTTALNSGKNLTGTIGRCPNMAEVGRYNFNGGEDGEWDSDTSVGAATVGSYRPNGWGLYDMHGNVSEWCLDWRQNDLGSSAQTDPGGPGPDGQHNRVTRGGSLSCVADSCRSAKRSGFKPSTQYCFLGFRLVAPPIETYLVVDLSGGAEATNYPVSYRTAPPPEGWSEEYKTTKLVLRRIPAGTFTMGSPGNELGRFDNETLHQVTLTQDFYAGVFEVTQKQWSLVMGNWPSWHKNEFWRDARPVEQVSYEDIRGSDAGSGWPANNLVDATSFLGKLRGKTGLDFDLPTEAQWEYACRAGTATALNSGKDWTGEKYCPNMNEVGRYYENGGEAGEGNSDSDASVGSAIVGSYRPNGWGLYDMHGNVWEWCLDWSNGSDYPGGEVTDPKGGSDGDRVHRGGAWYSGARYCRSAYRSQIYPSLRYLSLGFRLAWPVP